MKQRSMTEFLGAENITPAEMHCRLKAVYVENTVNRTTVNRWAIKFCLKLHLLVRKNSKQCRLPARFFSLFFGTRKQFT
jgi:hypothetical protein